MKSESALILACVMALSACKSDSSSTPAGQVVATVNGTEITTAELNQEMAGFTANGLSKDAAQQAAINALLMRHIVADAAVNSKLDRLPATAVMQEKARQMVLIEALSQNLRDSVPPPSREEAESYVNEHPNSFSQRRIFIVDQLIVPTVSQQLVKALEPLNTMPEIEAYLKSQGIGFNRTVGTIDALAIDGDAAEKMAQLPPNAVFISPERSALRVNYIRDTVTQPLQGDAAIKLATETLHQRRTQEMLNNKMNELMAAGQKNVRFNPAYAPKKAGKPAQAQ